MNPAEFHPEWNDVAALIRARGAARPDDPAVEVAGKSATYGALDDLSDRVAASLAGMGLVKGDRVASFAYNCLEQLLVWFGCAKLGVIWVPLNVSLLGDDLAYALNDCAPKLLVTDAETRSKVDDVWPALTIRPRRATIGADGEAGFDHLLCAPSPPPEVEVLGSDPAVILYTGGTTGLPKGVVLPQFAWIAAGYRYVETFGAGPGDRHLSIAALFHAAGLMIGTIGPLVAGIPTFIERWFSVSRFWDRARETGATIIDPIGTMVTLLCQQPPSPRDRDHHVRISMGALSQVPPGVADEFRARFGIEVVNVYSLSESGGVFIVHNKAGSPKPAANGKPWGWCEIRIVDEADQALAPNKVGEITLRPTLPYTFMLGYLNNAEATVRCLRNLWLHTGDLGYLDDDGYLYFTGRQAHWLRTRGENVSAYEVEAVLSNFEGVAEAIVIGVPAKLGEEDVKAFIRPLPGHDIDPAALFRWCEQRLAAFKLPRYIAFVDEFPRSSTKREVERHKLKAHTNDAAWDAETVFGRRSLRPARSRSG